MANDKPPLDINALRQQWRSGSPRVIQIQRIEDFIKLTTWLYTSDKVIFRGQRCDWPLLPTVGRESKRSKWLYKERENFEEFRREAIPYLSFMPENDWQWLAVAQHNGLPTRLLDWSKNPLVALWFAVSEPACIGKPGVVWAHSYQPSGFSGAVYNTKDLPSPFSINRTKVYFPEHVFPYIQAQAGVFTIHHRSDKDNRFVPFQEMKSAHLLLTKIEIPPEDFWVMRHHLVRLGVHPASLFPGLSGLVARIRYENERLEDEPEEY